MARAADAEDVSVSRTRFVAVRVGAAVAGLAGSELTLSHLNLLTERTTVSSVFSCLVPRLVVLFSAGRTRTPVDLGGPHRREGETMR